MFIKSSMLVISYFNVCFPCDIREEAYKETVRPQDTSLLLKRFVDLDKLHFQYKSIVLLAKLLINFTSFLTKRAHVLEPGTYFSFIFFLSKITIFLTVTFLVFFENVLYQKQQHLPIQGFIVHPKFLKSYVYIYLSKEKKLE